MEFLADYGLFLAKTLTLVVALVFVVVVIAANAARKGGEAKPKGHLTIENLNERLEDMKADLQHALLDEEAFKAEEKAAKKKAKEERKRQEQEEPRKRIFVLSFDGDAAASEVEELRQVINGLLQVARAGKDEVMLRLESPGGMVHGYGLAASQLARLREHQLFLTICVDKVAASGGYMMACIANRLLAAPFAYIGSIGVLVQLPNLHRLLKENNIDFEMIMAGEYKRTLTTFGENTDEDRAKVQEEVNEMHRLFKEFIHQFRPALDLAAAATGEVWSGSQALQRGLVDGLATSDEWLLRECKEADVYELGWDYKRPFVDRITSLVASRLRSTARWALTETLVRNNGKARYFS